MLEEADPAAASDSDDYDSSSEEKEHGSEPDDGEEKEEENEDEQHAAPEGSNSVEDLTELLHEFSNGGPSASENNLEAAAPEVIHVEEETPAPPPLGPPSEPEIAPKADPPPEPQPEEEPESCPATSDKIAFVEDPKPSASSGLSFPGI